MMDGRTVASEEATEGSLFSRPNKTGQKEEAVPWWPLLHAAEGGEAKGKGGSCSDCVMRSAARGQFHPTFELTLTVEPFVFLLLLGEEKMASHPSQFRLQRINVVRCAAVHARTSDAMRGRSPSNPNPALVQLVQVQGRARPVYCCAAASRSSGAGEQLIGSQ